MTRRNNEEWLNDLRGNGEAYETAIADLRSVIARGLPFALSRWLSPANPQFDALVEEVTQDTVLRVLDQIDTFEGRSQFTTWVHKIAIRIALTGLRRKRWQDSSLDEIIDTEDKPTPQGLLRDTSVSPEQSAERADMLAHVRRVIDEELTERQRNALVMLGLQGMPMEVTAKKLNTNRNALYKLLHDARLRLKSRLESEGLSAQDILTAFEQG